MTVVLSLIAPPGALSAGAVADLAARLGARISWLSPGEACDLVPTGDGDAALAAAREMFGGAPVDANLVPTAGRRKRLLVADMESTLIRNEMLDELAETIGIGAQVAAITTRTMNGELDFQGSLRARVALLKGVPATRLDAVAARIVDMPGAATLVATMRAHGARTAIVSGGFTCFTGLVRARLGADHDEGNVLEFDGPALAGTVREPILDAAGKVAALRRHAERYALDADEIVATGDGANDLAMLAVAGMGVAFRAKPRVAAAARVNIVHGDLTALLFLQGYARAEFVAPA
jgi:phosphoserine phosphatase